MSDLSCCIILYEITVATDSNTVMQQPTTEKYVMPNINGNNEVTVATAPQTKSAVFIFPLSTNSNISESIKSTHDNNAVTKGPKFA